MSELKFHHIGCLVENIDSAAALYGVLFNNKVSAKIYVSSQKLNVCFIGIGNEEYLELIESAGDNSVIENLRKRGFTYYHVGYTVKNMEKCIEQLCEMNFKLISTFNSEAYDGKKCAFLISPDSHMFELIEE